MPRMTADDTKLPSVVDPDGYILAIIFRARPTLTCSIEGKGLEIVSSLLNVEHV